MLWKPLCFSLLLSAAAALPGQAALVISEVLFNEVGSDVTGEWIEIFNTGPSAIDLSSYKIGDEETSGATSTTEGMFQFPAGATILPGEVQIVSAGATRFQTVYGFLPTYETIATDALVPDMTVYSAWDPDGQTINMANGGDHALILGPDDSLVDAVNWDNDTFLNPGIVSAEADGQSYERVNAFRDTDTADDWQLGPSSDTAANRSTPGTVPIPEPASAVLAVLASIALVRGRSRR